MVKVVPWNRWDSDTEAGGEVPEEVDVGSGDRVGGGASSGFTYIVNTKARVPREFYIIHTYANMLGYTRWCGGCSCWARGLEYMHMQKCVDPGFANFKVRGQGEEC